MEHKPNQMDNLQYLECECIHIYVYVCVHTHNSPKIDKSKQKWQHSFCDRYWCYEFF